MKFKFSLRTWRWTGRYAVRGRNINIFSTHVEMNRDNRRDKTRDNDFLYARGDEPTHTAGADCIL